MLRLRDLRPGDARRLLRVDDDADEPRLPNVVTIRFFFVGFLKKFKLNVGNFMVYDTNARISNCNFIHAVLNVVPFLFILILYLVRTDTMWYCNFTFKKGGVLSLSQ